MSTDIWKFDNAIKLLGKRRQLVIHRMPERGHVFRLVLKQNTYAKLSDPFAFHRQKRKKRRRPPSPWFLERCHRMDAGQHEGFAQIEVWAESLPDRKNQQTVTPGMPHRLSQRLPLPMFVIPAKPFAVCSA